MPHSKRESRSKAQVPVVAFVGAAGSQRALKSLFVHLAEDSDMTFLVVIRAAQARVRELLTLLQKHANRPVIEATDGQRLKVNHVYVVPGGTQATIVSNRLHLCPQPATAKKSPKQTLDTFLNSLAKSHGAQSVVVLLSGTGMDGVAGVKRIIEAGGKVFIQHPEEATHPALPRRALAASSPVVTATVDDVAHMLAQLESKGSRKPVGSARQPISGPNGSDWTQDDLRNLIAASDVSAVFLDRQLHISRFTPQSTSLFHLSKQDIGKSIEQVSHSLRHTGVAQLAARVSETAKPIAETVQSEDDRWYTLHLHPYQTRSRQIDGVVITVADISDLKRAESEERQRYQQQALAELSRTTLDNYDLDALFVATTERVAHVLNMELCKVLELQPDGKHLLLRAGVGWRPGIVGRATVPARAGSQAGYTLLSKSPVVVSDLETENRFQGPSLLIEHQVRSGISVIIGSVERPFGVLGVHSRDKHHFAAHDVEFLNAVANILATAVERQQTAQSLSESTARLRLASKVGGLAIAEVDYLTDSITLSVEAALLFGLPSDVGTVSRSRVHKLAHPEDQSRLSKAIADALDPDGEGWFVLEHRIVRPTGECLWLHVSKQVFFAQRADGSRYPLRALMVARDITSRKRAEEKLSRSEERYRYLFREMDEGFCVIEMIFDEDGKAFDYRFLEANPAFERFTGLAQAVGRTARELVPELEDHWFEIYGEIATSGKPRRFEEGSETMGAWFDVYAFRAGGDRSRRVAILFNNITERKRFEAQLRQQAYLLDSVRDAVISTDINFQIQTWNRGAEHKFGWTAEEAINQNLNALLSTKYLDDEPVPTQEAILMQEHWHGEVLQRTKSGDELFISTTNTLVRDEEGDVKGFVIISRNVTDRRLAEERLRFLAEARSELSQSLDYYTTLQNIARAAVPRIADWCSIDLRTEDGAIENVSIAHADPEKVLWAEALMERYPVDPEAEVGMPAVIRTGKSAFYPTISDALLQAAARSEEELQLLRSVGYRSAMVVPLSTQETVLGAITFVATETNRSFDAFDLSMAEDLARHAAVAIENARLYQALQQREERLRASETRFRQLADAMPQIVWVSVGSKEGDLEYINHQWYTYTGLPSGHNVGTEIQEMIHPDDRMRVQERWAESVDSGLPWESEYRLRSAEGQYRWFLGRAVPILDREGKITSWFGTATDIDERKVIEEELRQSEERFRSAFEQAAVGMAHLDLEGRYVRVNDRLCEILGYSRRELMQKTFIEVTHPHDLSEDLALTARQMAGEITFHSLEKRYMRKDDAIIWANMTASVIVDKDGVPSYWIAVIEDITQRKEAEAALRQSEERFRAIQQTTPDVFMLLESMRNQAGNIVDFRWLYINPAGERMFERTNEYLVGKRLLEEIPGNRKNGMFDAYVRVVETGTVWQDEFAYASNHSNRWFRATAARTGDGFAVTFVDITLQKEIEAALAESENRFRTTFEQAGVGMAHTDQDGRYLQVNERLCAILGYSRAELLQKTFMEITYAEDLAANLVLNEQLASGQLPSYSIEKRYVRRDRSLIWVNLTASLVRNEQGEVQYRLAVIEDISARKAAEEALQKLNATLEQRVQERTLELQRSNRDLDQFAYVASHDLRAPLRAISHLSSWIAEDSGHLLPAPSKEHLTKLRLRTKRMERLLEDLLTYSRVGRRDGMVEEVHCGTLIEEVMELLAPPPGFSVKTQGELPVLKTLRPPLEMIFRNLIANAIKHHGQPQVGEVRIGARILGDFVQFSVSDNGPGIDSQYHERIFSLFQTLRPRDEVEGSGMGLAVVKKTVEHYGGKVSVESECGQGAKFLFTWPLQVFSKDDFTAEPRYTGEHDVSHQEK